MTIIAIRKGIMAVDSNAYSNGTLCGETKKYREVPEFHGGGFVAASGNSSEATKALEEFISTGCISITEGYNILWLRRDGIVRSNDGGLWFSVDAEFYALGAGIDLAFGAMAHGATAEEAVKIACKYETTCGGTVHVLSVNDG